jgi:hypothetical protein
MDVFHYIQQSMELEAFEESVRGHKILIFDSIELALSRFFLVESNSLYKGKNILIISDTGNTPQISNPLLFRKRWDVIFRLKDAFDAQMIATFVAHSTKPARILWVSSGQAGDTIPKTLWSKWTAADITLFCLTQASSYVSCEWDVILFPLGYTYDIIERNLSQRHGHIPIMLQRIKQNILEIYDAKAGIAWSCLDHKGTPGTLYWYDPSEGKSTHQLFTKSEASTLLGSISKWLDT